MIDVGRSRLQAFHCLDILYLFFVLIIISILNSYSDKVLIWSWKFIATGCLIKPNLIIWIAIERNGIRFQLPNKKRNVDFVSFI